MQRQSTAANEATDGASSNCCCFGNAMESTALGGAKWFTFILKSDSGIKIQLNHVLSTEAGSTGDYGLCVDICSWVTKKSDTCCNAFCAACFCSLKENCCSTCVDPICLLTAKTTAIYDEMKKSEADLSIVPAKKFMVKLMTKTYLSDVYGMRKTRIKPDETSFTSSQIEDIAAAFAKINDDMASERIIRILNVGTCDHRITPNQFYKLFMSIPFASCCYAGSYSQGRKLAAYMQDVGIEYEELREVIENFDARWAAYLQDFFVRCITDNEDEVNRMTTGKIADKSIVETMNKLRASVVTEPDAAEQKLGGQQQQDNNDMVTVIDDKA